MQKRNLDFIFLVSSSGLSELVKFSGIAVFCIKAPITTVADDSHKSARQRIHLKNQALFSSKDKSKT